MMTQPLYPQPLSEPQIKTRLVALIQDDFEIRPEVRGRHLIEPTQPVIDFLLYPRPTLIQMGFDPHWFGIEVKGLSPHHPGDLGKKTRLIHQAISYAQTEFRVNHDEWVRPCFVLVAVDPQPIPPCTLGSNEHLAEWGILLGLAGYQRVGQFRFPGRYGWEMTIGRAPYFKRETGRSRVNPFGKKSVGSL